MSNATIRLATSNDLSDLSLIHERAYLAPASYVQIRQQLELSPDLTLVAEVNNVPVGSLFGAKSTTPYVGWILGVAVTPGHQRNGIGTQLLARCIELFDENDTTYIKLSVAPNSPAIRLYERCGFEPLDHVNRYFGDEPRLRMIRTVPEKANMT